MTAAEAWAASAAAFGQARIERRRGCGWWADYYAALSDGLADLACKIERNTQKAAPALLAGREIER